jgi:hypothetical protein
MGARRLPWPALTQGRTAMVGGLDCGITPVGRPPVQVPPSTTRHEVEPKHQDEHSEQQEPYQAAAELHRGLLERHTEEALYLQSHTHPRRARCLSTSDGQRSSVGVLLSIATGQYGLKTQVRPRLAGALPD